MRRSLTQSLMRSGTTTVAPVRSGTRHATRPGHQGRPPNKTKPVRMGRIDPCARGSFKRRTTTPRRLPFLIVYRFGFPITSMNGIGMQPPGETEEPNSSLVSQLVPPSFVFCGALSLLGVSKPALP